MATLDAMLPDQAYSPDSFDLSTLSPGCGKEKKKHKNPHKTAKEAFSGRSAGGEQQELPMQLLVPRPMIPHRHGYGCLPAPLWKIPCYSSALA
ncbi:hypothetical protein VTH06DRAFT_797 [Thermothelomyces fergusii]